MYARLFVKLLHLDEMRKKMYFIFLNIISAIWKVSKPLFNFFPTRYFTVQCTPELDL